MNIVVVTNSQMVLLHVVCNWKWNGNVCGFNHWSVKYKNV